MKETQYVYTGKGLLYQMYHWNIDKVKHRRMQLNRLKTKNRKSNSNNV